MTAARATHPLVRRTGAPPAAGLALAIVALLLGGCGRSFTEADESVEEANLRFEQMSHPDPPDLTPLRSPDAAAYRIGPGDRLEVEVPSAPEMNRTGLLVRPDGRATLPLIGDVKLSGLTTEEAAKAISAGLAHYLRRSDVTVGIGEAQGARLLVLGAAATPGTFALRGPTTLLEALAEAGGVAGANSGTAPAADLERSYLLREGRIVPVRIDRLLAGDMTQNIYVRGGDMLYLQPAAAGEVFVLGQVQSPGVIPADSSLTLIKALSVAGGVTKDAKDSAVRIIRGSLIEPRIYLVDSQDITAGLRRDVHLLPGDIVFVTTTELADWNYILGQITPTLQSALSARYLIEGPNGLIFQ